jgi:ribA/ribD-fused uncharacterized protein
LKKDHQSQERKPAACDASTESTAVPPTIKFYRSNEKPYGAFSNLFRSVIEFEGKVYPTAEHAYQAGKAARPEVREWILSAPSPSLAAMAAHGLYTWDIVPNWAEIKFDRMRRVLRAKFTQHLNLTEVLLSTGSARLVEAGTVNNAVNKLWGEVNGVGQNMLGVMLMELRDELSKANRESSGKTKSKKAQAKAELERYDYLSARVLANATK